MSLCLSCGSENSAGVKFCGECGAALATVCPACSTANELGRKFCGECGGALITTSTTDSAQPATLEAPVAERRLVSVLFADLVGFTPLSESRDPEEVRELLSRYFDTCRRLVELYGGTVEKFIGDAVMAVWGTPVAQEDDAERAVRTALDLAAAVTSLGEEARLPELRARVGVLTGEAAVNLAAAGEGMVAGDLVNTAARIQAAAEPGSVFVGEATRRASERAVAFENAGEHALKGKTEPVQLFRAVRVTAARGGALRSEGLEAPFVGRERELRLVKELFHASAEQGRAQLVQIAGIAGIGKSRLAWEFFKYLDGLAEPAWWHRGRCLAYGEGIAYWALAEMVRTRAGIVEGEQQTQARRKLADTVAEHVPVVEERSWVEPRLANLLGLEERRDTNREDLFAAWRLFFERLADESPVVLVFEDLQWGDEALLAFIEYLLEWSSSQRLYVLALSRPELADEHPEFGRTVRNATTLALEPLGGAEMAELLDGYVPGLPEPAKEQILERAQGIPLYAVETVRMLLDRRLLVQEGSVYRPTGEIETLDVPETLHALVAARLDGLAAEERRLVQDACVLGKSFTKQALAALTRRPEPELEPLLTALVRKEVLALEADPRMPQRGQYSFLQELLRQVAYETLSRRERKARHLAAVAGLEKSAEDAEQEIPEVIAAHLLAACQAVPDDPDTPEITTRARSALVQAGERAAALAAPEEGERYLDQAVALAGSEPLLQAELLVQAGRFAYLAGRTAEARTRLGRAIGLYEEEGETQGAARAGVALADVDQAEGRLEEAMHRFESALPTLEEAGPSVELAATLASLGRMQMLRGELGAGTATLERALALSEALGLEETLIEALTSRATLLIAEERVVEAQILLEAALARAEAGEFHATWTRAENNLAVLLQTMDLHLDALALTEQMEATTRQRGNREWLTMARIGSITSLVELGRWQEALERVAEADERLASPFTRADLVTAVPVLCDQGRVDAAAALLADQEWQRNAEQTEVAVAFAGAEARLLRAQNRPEEALAAAERGLSHREELGVTSLMVRNCLWQALEAAFDLGELTKADVLLASVDDLRPGQITPSLDGHRTRFRARLSARRGEHRDVERNYRRAQALFSEHGFAFHQAATELEHAEWLVGQSRSEQAQRLLAHARETFEQLAAEPWLQRVDAVRAEATAPA
ncbi:MAG TPA: adenylate/guanylate cyclase domain-containing protein [Gaiellaceae bacterium]|nr:adenylate/guanylate cyclase domain-containing protein [Gaiellaceae bacterium]